MQPCRGIATAMCVGIFSVHTTYIRYKACTQPCPFGLSVSATLLLSECSMRLLVYNNVFKGVVTITTDCAPFCILSHYSKLSSLIMSQSSRSSLTLHNHAPMNPAPSPSALSSELSVVPVSARLDIEHIPVPNDPRAWSPLRKVSCFKSLC